MEMITWFIILRNLYNPIRGKNNRESRMKNQYGRINMCCVHYIEDKSNFKKKKKIGKEKEVDYISCAVGHA